MAEAKSELQFTALSRTADLWKSISSAIMTIVDEAHFEANAEGIQFRSMDPSHVALVDITCPAVAFEKYDCPSLVKFGFRVDDFAKVTKRADSGDTVELSVADSMLNVRTSGKYNRSYKLKLIESSGGSQTPVPKLEFDNKLVMTPSILDKILSDIEVLNSKITIETTADRTVIFSTSSEMGEGKVTIDDGSGIENLSELSVGTPAKATFSTEIMAKIVKAVGTSSQSVTAEYSSNKPLRLTFTLSNSVKIEFFMAPRVEN
jgi:proliferating cell nuclear antigen